MKTIACLLLVVLIGCQAGVPKKASLPRSPASITCTECKRTGTAADIVLACRGCGVQRRGSDELSRCKKCGVGISADQCGFACLGCGKKIGYWEVTRNVSGTLRCGLCRKEMRPTELRAACVRCGESMSFLDVMKCPQCGREVMFTGKCGQCVPQPQSREPRNAHQPVTRPP